MLIARHDPTLRARITARRALRYDEGPDAALDRPGHVRAASAIVGVGAGHVVIQDDALFAASLVGDAVHAITLPALDGVRQFDEGRGNKSRKPDLEAALAWTDGVIVGFGSGSSPARERLLILRDGAEPALRDAAPLYAALRDALAGAPLNVEGALRWGSRLRLLQRGNGAGGVDATLDVDAAWLDAWLAGGDPRAPEVVAARWSLGELGGVRLSFTDGLAWRGRWFFAAAAEDSADTIADGAVTGSAIGWADDRGGAWAPVVDADGQPASVKLEGLCASGDALWGVLDADDPDRPSELVTLTLEGPWPR
jgi:hypothetical protein